MPKLNEQRLSNVDASLYTEEELAEILHRAKKKVDFAKFSLIRDQPFLGVVATHLFHQIIVDDILINTAATDGEKIIFNALFVDMLTQDETLFLYAHEVLHCLFEHTFRGGGKNVSLWNMAADYVINLILVDEGIGTPMEWLNICLDPRYRGKTTEEVYSILCKNPPNNHSLLDIHLEGVPTSAEETHQKIMSSISFAGGISSAPKTLQNVMGWEKEGDIAWQEYLRDTVSSILNKQLTYLKPSRKQLSNVILPGYKKNKTVDIAISIDISGSITLEHKQKILTELYSIFSTYQNFNLHIWNFDTEISDYEHIEEHCADKILTHPFRFGGGTDFLVNWEFMYSKNIKPDMFIMFTDGEPSGGWGDPYYCDTLFVIGGNKNKCSPFGKTVYIR